MLHLCVCSVWRKNWAGLAYSVVKPGNYSDGGTPIGYHLHVWRRTAGFCFAYCCLIKELLIQLSFSGLRSCLQLFTIHCWKRPQATRNDTAKVFNMHSPILFWGLIKLKCFLSGSWSLDIFMTPSYAIQYVRIGTWVWSQRQTRRSTMLVVSHYVCIIDFIIRVLVQPCLYLKFRLSY